MNKFWIKLKGLFKPNLAKKKTRQIKPTPNTKELIDKIDQEYKDIKDRWTFLYKKQVEPIPKPVNYKRYRKLIKRLTKQALIIQRNRSQERRPHGN